MTTNKVRQASRKIALAFSSVLVSLVLPTVSHGQSTSVWNDIFPASADFNTAGSWTPAGVPGALDTANFSNVWSHQTITFSADAINANAIFTWDNANVERAFSTGSQTYLITNSFVLGPLAGQAVSVGVSGGNLVITNSSGTAQLVAGEGGFGSFFVSGGSLLADRIIATNGANSRFSFRNPGGTATTLHGAIINQSGFLSSFTINGGTWNIFGGTNTITSDIDARFSYGGKLVASGNATLVTLNDLLYIGHDVNSGGNNQLVVSNGAHFFNTASVIVSLQAGNDQSKIIATGNNSLLDVTGNITVGNVGSSNQLLVADGATIRASGGVGIGGDSTANDNTARVTGSNSFLVAGANVFVGPAGSRNSLQIDSGGVVTNNSLRIGGGGVDNRVLITGPGSKNVSLTDIRVGQNGAGQMIVSNGATAKAPTLFVGTIPSDFLIGPGSFLVTDNGILEANGLVSGTSGSGTISNIGGVYQFTSPTPTIVANSANSIMVQNGTISFKGINNAPVNQAGTQLTNITYQGNNAYRLVSATNTAVASYTFQLNNTPNYAALVLDNGRFQAANVTIDSGASLSGNGTVAGNVTNLGTIAPGFSPGQLTITGNLVLASSSMLEMEIGGVNPVDYDQLIVGGDVTVTGTLAIAMINAFSPTPGDTFTLIDNQGANPIFGLFNGLTNNAFIDASGNGSDAYFTIHYDGGTGNDLVLLATIPEPSTTLLLFGVGVFILLGRRR